MQICVHDWPCIVNHKLANATDMGTFEGLNIQYDVASGQVHQRPVDDQLRFLVMTDHHRFGRLN